MSYFQWLHLHVSSLRGYTWTVYIKHVQSSGHILYSGISYLGLLSKDSIASSPAFLRRRYIVIKCTINLMEPAALISCCVCQTIETTFYNWWGNYELQEILCSLGFIQALFCCSLELILFPCTSATWDLRSWEHFSGAAFLGVSCSWLHNLPGFILVFDIRENLKISAFLQSVLSS